MKMQSSTKPLRSSLHCALLPAQVVNCANHLHSRSVTRVKSTFFPNRQFLDNCRSWSLCPQCSEWAWKLLSWKRDLLTPCPLTQAKLFPYSSSLAVSEEMREMMLALLHRQTATAALCFGNRDTRFALEQRRNLCHRSSAALHSQFGNSWALVNDALWNVYSIHFYSQPWQFLKRQIKGFNAKKNEWENGINNLQNSEYFCPKARTQVLHTWKFPHFSTR